MDTSTTLEEQIQALMDSLADTALSAAESRHQSQAGEAHLLYALYRNDGLVGSMLRGYGLESSEIRLLMSDIPNRPLKMGEDPVLSSSSRHILHDAHDAGTYRCTITDGKDDSAVRDVRLIVTADNKVGLYDADGKALK